MPSVSSILRRKEREERAYSTQNALRTARAFADWAVDTSDRDCPVSIIDNGTLGALPMKFRAKESETEFTTIQRNAESNSTLTRQLPSEGSYVEMEASEFWNLPLADQKIVLSRLARAPGAAARMEASKAAGKTLKITITDELLRQSYECRQLRRVTGPSTRKGPLKHAAKSQSKRDQKTANKRNTDGGTASFKRGPTHRITTDYLGEDYSGTRKLRSGEAGMLLINKATQEK